MEEFNHSDPMPKYLQLQNILTRQIQSDSYKIGDKLCTDAELKKHYKLSTSTVTRALYELEQAGFVTRKQGSGTYVRSKTNQGTKHRPAQTSSQGGKVLLICGAQPDFDPAHENVNWFIGHEIYRGLVNSFDGGVRIVLPEELAGLVDAALSGGVSDISRTHVALVNRRAMLDGVLAKMRSHAMPHVVIDQLSQSARLSPDTIGLDHLRGVYDGMVYLMEELGHRDVAFIGPQREELTVQHRGRWSGYLMGLQAFNISMREELVAYAESGGMADGYRAARQLLERRVKFTAVFVSTDIKAIGAIRALREAGLKVPEDVSVLGFDDVPGIEKNDPPLTTVRLPYFEAGAAAVKLLETPPGADGTRPGQVLPSRLIVRASCAPAKSRAIAG